MRARISSTAERLFVADGVEGVSMRRIADEVGISATAIYRHYEGKDALLDEISERGLTILRETLERALARPVTDRLDAISAAYLTFALEHPRHYDFIFIVPRSNVRRFGDGLARRRSSTFNILLDEVTRAIDEGRLTRGDPTEIAFSIAAHMHGLVALYRSGRFEGDDAQFRSLYRKSVRHLMTGLRARNPE